MIDTHATYQPAWRELDAPIFADLHPGDEVTIAFRTPAHRWQISGTLAQRGPWLVIAGVDAPVIWRDGDQISAGKHLDHIVDHKPAARPYAEGTDRIEPRFGDVVEGTTPEDQQRQWLYALHGTPNPWLMADHEAKQWWSTDDLPHPLRLIAELREVAA